MWLKRSAVVMTTAEIWHCDGALPALPGLRGTTAVGIGLPAVLNRILEALESLCGARFSSALTLDSMLDSLNTRGDGDKGYPRPSRATEAVSNSPCRPRPHRLSPAGSSEPPQCNAC